MSTGLSTLARTKYMLLPVMRHVSGAKSTSRTSRPQQRAYRTHKRGTLYCTEAVEMRRTLAPGIRLDSNNHALRIQTCPVHADARRRLEIILSARFCSPGTRPGSPPPLRLDERKSASGARPCRRTLESVEHATFVLGSSSTASCPLVSRNTNIRWWHREKLAAEGTWAAALFITGSTNPFSDPMAAWSFALSHAVPSCAAIAEQCAPYVCQGSRLALLHAAPTRHTHAQSLPSDPRMSHCNLCDCLAHRVHDRPRPTSFGRLFAPPLVSVGPLSVLPYHN